MKSYNLELLKLSGLDFVFKNNLKQKAPTTTSITQNQPIQQEQKLTLAELQIKYSNCTKCSLSKSRNCFVYGEGNPHAKVMLIGEGPGAKEDATGKVFVGPAGELLTKMLAAIDIHREDIYITNIVKCRPPQNRDPSTAEKDACLPYLLEQIDLIKPKVLVLLGRVAATTILKEHEGTTLNSFRDKAFYFRNIRTFVTYHPAALLHNPKYKLPAWHDLQYIQHYLENN